MCKIAIDKIKKLYYKVVCFLFGTTKLQKSIDQAKELSQKKGGKYFILRCGIDYVCIGVADLKRKRKAGMVSGKLKRLPIREILERSIVVYENGKLQFFQDGLKDYKIKF